MSTQTEATQSEMDSRNKADNGFECEKVVRDVRTLLLCKVNVHHARKAAKEAKGGAGAVEDDGKIYKECYNGIYSGPVDSQCRQFVTYGNFDAISIYATAKAENEDWLQSVRIDNQQISANLSSERCYLPVHLVTYQENASRFWKNAEGFPACLTTLVYGRQRNSEEESSCHDVMLTRHIKSICETNPPAEGSKLEYFVYQAINICDAVVFWMTDNINAVLKLSAELARKGIARKTFSIMGFDRQLMIQDNNQSALRQLCCRLQDHGKNDYQVRIQGSIRDHEKAKKFFLAQDSAKVLEWITGHTPEERAHLAPSKAAELPSVSTVCVFGNDDFTVDIQKTGLEQLLNLAFKMLENSMDISLACWEIHTEFTLPGTYQTEHLTTKPVPHPIHEALDKFLVMHKEFFSAHITRYPWVLSYLELLVTHVNIDHDPILHAPASLFLGLVWISNEYFARATQENGYRKQYQQILDNSRIAIQRTIRHWSQLTDQLTQADDLVFHGIGNDPAIYETLPESLLEFYHEYLREIVKSIISLGDFHKPGWTNWDYDSDFLLVPDQNQNPRISKMFHVTELHEVLLENACSMRICKGCKENGRCRRNSSWPEKQVYLVEFQSDLLYDPIAFLFPVLHECFHNFGDKFRMRGVRAECLAEIIRLEIQSMLGLLGKEYRELGEYLQKKLMISQPEGLNLMRTESQIYKNWECLFLGAPGELFEDQFIALKQSLKDPFYLDNAEVFGRWREIGRGFQAKEYMPTKWRQLIKKWAYYFKECYADLMSLLWLELPITSYLRLLEQEWAEAYANNINADTPETWRYIQRTSLVIGVYSFGWHHGSYTKEELDKAWEEKKIDESLSALESQGFVALWKEKIKATIYSLHVKAGTDDIAVDDDPSDNSQNSDLPDKLILIKKYLYRVKTAFLQSIEDEEHRKLIGEIRKYYVQFFKEGKQFTEAFNATLKKWKEAHLDEKNASKA